MNATAQKELLDVIMLDDFVSRRGALLTWTKRWIGTLKCDALMNSNLRSKNRMEKGPVSFDSMEKAALVDQIFVGVINAPVKIVDMQVQEGATDTKIIATLHVILQEPRT